MKLSRPERNGIRAGDMPALRRPDKPDIAPGDQITIAYFTRTHIAAIWITIRKISRHRKGDWIIRYDVYDRRDPAVFPARGGDHYTTDPAKASDTAEAILTEPDRKRLAVESRARRAQQTEGTDAQRRREERAVRDRVREAMTDLNPDAQTAMLIEIEKVIRKAQMRRASQAA